MLLKFLPRLLLVLGIGANIALLLINAAPQRPHLAKRRAYKVLVRMQPDEAAWVKDNELAEFAASHDFDIEVEAVPTYQAILARLAEEKAHPTNILLVDMNDELGDDAMRDGLIRPISDGATPESLAKVKAEFLPEGLERGSNGTKKLWMLPSRAAVDVALYLKPAVEDAYLHWADDRDKIDAALKAVNGEGLPRGYSLERSPDNWDSFDLFVAGWYWAHHPAPWAGEQGRAPAPRMAIRTGKSDDAVRDMLALFYAQGAKDDDIAHGKLDDDAVVDALQWQALWKREGLTVHGKKGVGVDNEEVEKLLLQNQLAWAPASATLSFRVHGGSRSGSPAGVDNPSQLAWAVLPRGVSMQLKDGKPARRGRSFSFQEIAFWAVPSSVKDPELAYKLARFATQTGLNQREAEALGSLPVRVDLRKNYPILFRLAWMQNIFDASFVQIETGSGDIPDEVSDQHLDDRYREFRKQVVFSRGPTAALDLPTIQKLAQEAQHGH